MDSPLPSVNVRPWRTATLVASAVAALELCLLIVAGIALLAKPLSRHAHATAVRRHARAVAAAAPAVHARHARPARPHLGRAETSILVLNGNGVNGAAGVAASRVRQLGYIVAHVDDASRTNYPTSVVMYRPGFRGEGKRLAHDLRIRVVGPLDGLRVRDLMGAHLALIVGH